jgi:hypothetical protein
LAPTKPSKPKQESQKPARLSLQSQQFIIALYTTMIKTLQRPIIALHMEESP